MNRKLIMILLCLVAAYLRELSIDLLSSVVGSIIVNLIGSIIFILVSTSMELSEKRKFIFNTVFLGSLTTYSGVFKVLIQLLETKAYALLLLYTGISFIAIPIITYPIYARRIR